MVNSGFSTTCRLLLLPTLLAFLLFTVTTIISYFLTKQGTADFTIGFPFHFYEQYSSGAGNESITAWLPANMLIDLIIAWSAAVIGYAGWLILFDKVRINRLPENNWLN